MKHVYIYIYIYTFSKNVEGIKREGVWEDEIFRNPCPGSSFIEFIGRLLIGSLMFDFISFHS